MKFNKHTIYISLFAVLYLIVAFSSFWHAVAFFGLANNTWMSVILALAFEIGQSAVLFSLLTSKKDRGRIMPWVLMSMFTLVQVIGNVYSSYKYIITNSVENLRYFKEPIFIWTDLPDAQANVIIVYLVGALLPIASLLLTSMITNYLTDIEESKKESQLINEENPLINQNSILQMENQGLQESLNNKDKELDSLKEELKSKQELIDSQNQKIDSLDKENQELVKEKFDKEPEDNKPDIQTFNEPEYIPTVGQVKEAIDELEKLTNEENKNDKESIEHIKESSGQESDEGDSEFDINEQLQNEIVNKETTEKTLDKDENPVIDENVKVADALMGGNILTKHKKDSHFINKP